MLALVIALVGGSVVVATAPAVRDLTRVSTLAFGTGGTECTLVNIASSFPADTPIRVAAEFSPPLSAYTVTDVLIWQDGRELIDLGSTTVLDAPRADKTARKWALEEAADVMVAARFAAHIAGAPGNRAAGKAVWTVPYIAADDLSGEGEASRDFCDLAAAICA